MQLFRRSMFSTECDDCGVKFAINSGGVCDQCRRILCNRHLHGSVWRRMAISLGAPYRCVACRTGQRSAAG